jgi:hypothetical protein
LVHSGARLPGQRCRRKISVRARQGKADEKEARNVWKWPEYLH